MTQGALRRPSADHPIRISPVNGRVTIRAGGVLVADTAEAVELAEASYPTVCYVPRKDVDMTRLAPVEHRTWCPYKGEAHYFDLVGADGARIKNAVWSYEAPPPDTAAIKDRVAFYPHAVDAISVA